MFNAFKKLFGKSSTPSQPAAKPPASAPASSPAPAAKAAPAAAAATSATAGGAAGTRKFTGECVEIPLLAVVNSLPDDLKPCIATLPDKSVQLKVPVTIAAEGLAKGAVKITFAELKENSPAGTFTGSTEHDQANVALPLKEIVPRLKPEHMKMRSGQKTIEVPDDIKPVFKEPAKAAAPAPAPAAAPAPAPAPSPAPKPAPAPTPAPAAPAAPAPAAAPASAATNPVEIAKQAASLPGIAGSLISMADGLAVAKHLPAGTNADALAGFIPDIFTRLTQYTKDLQLGEVNCVTVQVGQQPLQIHRCGKLYLSALGAAGAALPAEQLTALARQLAQLNK